MANKKSKIKFVVSPDIDIKEKKYCWFKKNNVKHVDYKDTDFLKDFMNAQGKILPRRVTGTSQKWQKRLSKAIKRARYMGMLPYVTSYLDK